MSGSDYERTEALLGDLLKRAGSVLSEQETNEVQHYIDVGEYGLALETLVYIVEEEKKGIPVEAVAIAKAAADEMGLDAVGIEEQLLVFVLDA